MSGFHEVEEMQLLNAVEASGLGRGRRKEILLRYEPEKVMEACGEGEIKN